MTWKPLSVRVGQRDDGPYEGVPPHLYEPLRHWVDNIFGGMPRSMANRENGRRLAAAIRYGFPPSDSLTVRDVTWALQIAPDVLLDAVDAVLHLKEVGDEDLRDLDEILLLGGSVWEVDPGSGRRLARRVGATAAAAFADAASLPDVTSAELREAWSAAYGRNPDASDAWDHSIKAVEAALIPIVTPAHAKATLADVVGSLNSQGSRWRLALHGQDGSQSVAPLVAMLRLMWPNPDRHGGSTSRQPSLDEAQAVVHLAVTVVQWARSGVVSKRR